MADAKGDASLLRIPQFVLVRVPKREGVLAMIQRGWVGYLTFVSGLGTMRKIYSNEVLSWETRKRISTRLSTGQLLDLKAGQSDFK